MSSLACKAFCLVICFLVLWFIYWSSLILFKNGSDYLLQVIFAFFHVIYPFGFSVMITPLPYFAPNISAFLTFGCWYVFKHSSPTCWQNFFFLVFWNALFCLHCLILYRYPFSLPSFTSNFWFISSSCIVYFNCVAFCFPSQYTQMFFVCHCIFACGRRFPVWFPIQFLSFCSCSFEEHQF